MIFDCNDLINIPLMGACVIHLNWIGCLALLVPSFFFFCSCGLNAKNQTHQQIIDWISLLSLVAVGPFGTCIIQGESQVQSYTSDT